MPLKSWDQGVFLIRELLKNKQMLESYRFNMLQSYSMMKHYFKENVRKVLEIN